jgi:hypothetical protein
MSTTVDPQVLSAPIEIPTNPIETEPKRRSGGPRTPEGKARSRRNSLKSGLQSQVVFPEDMANNIAQRTREFTESFGAKTPYEEALIRDMALNCVRFERASAISCLDNERLVERANDSWESDRREMVEDLAAQLSHDPRRVAKKLRNKKQGVDWLLDRWDELADVLENNGQWDDDQRALAFDLLGVGHDERIGNSRVPAHDNVEGMRALIDEQVKRLRAYQAILVSRDQSERNMTIAGMPLTEDEVTARVRQQEGTFRRQHNRALAELLRFQAAVEEAKAEKQPTIRDPFEISSAAIDHLVAHSSPPSFLLPRGVENYNVPPEIEAYRRAVLETQISKAAVVPPAPAPEVHTEPKSPMEPRSEPSPLALTKPPTAAPATVPLPAPAEGKKLSRRARREKEMRAREAARHAARAAKRA